MHYNIERYLNGLQPASSADLPEMTMFHDFYNEVLMGGPVGAPAIKPFRTEWRIAAPDLSLAGSVDFVGTTAANEYVIIDWKRSKKLPTSLDNTFRKQGMPPLRHIADCDLNKYFLQLNVYRYILEKYYSINVSKMLVVSMHPSLDGYFMAEAPIWHSEVELILRGIQDKDKDASLPPSTVMAPPTMTKLTSSPF